MRRRFLTSLGTAAVVLGLMSLASLPMAGQAPAPAAKAAGKAWTMPRTPDGHPDFQGNWNLATLTPLERPNNAKDQHISNEEAATLEKAEKDRVAERAQPSKGDRPAPPVGGNVGGYNNFWIDRGDSVITINGQRRTGLIIDPPDGKIPKMTAEGTRRNADRPGVIARPRSDAAESAAPSGQGAYDDPEIRPLGERCLLGFGSTSGPPTLPNYFYNNFKTIVQTPENIMILVEMDHDTRIIRMNKPHLPKTVRNWMGDSVGRWEGDTLVVDTTNFTDKTSFRGSSQNLHVIERFTRYDENTILYRFTIDDPSTWEKQWTGEVPWVATNDLVFEYACHEGNYALGDILRGSRLLEKEAVEKSSGTRK